MSYEGFTAEIPMGVGGLDLRTNKTAIEYYKLTKADNIEVLDGFTGKEGGSTKANASALSGTPSIIEGIDYFPTTTVQRTVIATSDGKLYKDDGTFTFATTLKSGLGTDKTTVFVEGGSEAVGNNKKLFSFNGFNPVQVLSGDGVTTSDLATPPADWTGNAQPVAGIVHNLRLWGIKGHFLYGSTTTNHEDFTSAGSLLFPVWPGEGIELFAVVPVFGRMFLFKRPYGVYYLDDSDPDSANWFIKKVTGAVGAGGPNAIAYTKSEALFVSSEGAIHFLSGVQEFGDVKASDLTDILNIERFTREDVNKNRLSKSHVTYYEDKKQVWIAFTSRTGTRNDRILKLDISDPQNIKPTITNKDSCESIWMRQDPTTKDTKPLLGGNDGFIRKADQSSRNIDGTSYTATLQTPFINFSHLQSDIANKTKLFDALEIEVKPVGDHNVNVDIFIDGNFAEPIVFNMGAASAALDSFVLDTDRVDGTGIITRRQFMSGSGRSISYQISNSGLNQDFQIARLTQYFRVAGEDLRS